MKKKIIKELYFFNGGEAGNILILSSYVVLGEKKGKKEFKVFRK